MEHERGGIDRLVSNRRLYEDVPPAGRHGRPAGPPGDRRPSRPATASAGCSCCARRSARRPPQFSAATKTFCTEFEQRVAGFCGRVLGPAGHCSPSPASARRVSRNICYAPGYTIMGGTTQILRNILGERILGLPASLAPPELVARPRSRGSEAADRGSGSRSTGRQPDAGVDDRRPAGRHDHRVELQPDDLGHRVDQRADPQQQVLEARRRRRVEQVGARGSVGDEPPGVDVGERQDVAPGRPRPRWRRRPARASATGPDQRVVGHRRRPRRRPAPTIGCTTTGPRAGAERAGHAVEAWPGARPRRGRRAPRRRPRSWPGGVRAAALTATG